MVVKLARLAASIRKIPTLLVLTIAVTTTAQAQIAAASRYDRVARAGQVAPVASFVSIDSDYRSRGRSTVNLIEAPTGGEAGIRYGSDYPSFVAAIPRSAFNRRRVPRTLLTYRANTGFTDPETFVVEAISPDGIAVRIRYALTVR